MADDELEDDLLYHYCSVDALYGILDSGHLRVTNIRYMNDSKEISWLFEIANQALLDSRYQTFLCTGASRRGIRSVRRDPNPW